MLDDKTVLFCPLTGEKVQWKLVNKKWTEKTSTRRENKETPAIIKITRTS